MSHGLQIPTFDAPALLRYGLPELVYGTSPAAGSDFSYSVDGSFFERLLSVHVRLVTSATVASREVVVSYEDAGGNRFALSGINTTVTASQTADYDFSVFTPEAVATVDASALVPLVGMLLLPTQVVKIHVVSVQAADQLSRIRFVRERFYTHDYPPLNVPVPGD